MKVINSYLLLKKTMIVCLQTINVTGEGKTGKIKFQRAFIYKFKGDSKIAF